jgi:uncharacterized membrane protein YesL
MALKSILPSAAICASLLIYLFLWHCFYSIKSFKFEINVIRSLFATYKLNFSKLNVAFKAFIRIYVLLVCNQCNYLKQIIEEYVLLSLLTQPIALKEKMEV